MLPSLWDTSVEQRDGLNFKQQTTRSLTVPITAIDHYVGCEAFAPGVVAQIGVAPPCGGMTLQVVARTGPQRRIDYQPFFIPPTRRTLSSPLPGSDRTQMAREGLRIGIGAAQQHPHPFACQLVF